MSAVQNLVDYLLKVINHADDQDELVAKMAIKEFLDSSIDFKQFRETVEKYSATQKNKNEDMLYLNDYAGWLKTDLTPEALVELKKLLEQAIAPVKFEKLNEETVLEATGNNLVMSKVIEQVERDAGFVSGQVTEVRIVATSILQVDMNLEQAKWHGKNFVVWTKELDVVKEKCVWNFSGFGQNKEYLESAGMDNEGNGRDGKDGEPG